MIKAKNIYEYIKGTGATVKDFSPRELHILSILFENLEKDDQIRALNYFCDRNFFKDPNRREVSSLLAELKKKFIIYTNKGTLPLQDSLGLYKYFVDEDGNITKRDKMIINDLFSNLSPSKQLIVFKYLIYKKGLSKTEKKVFFDIIEKLYLRFNTYTVNPERVMYGTRNIYKYFINYDMSVEEIEETKEEVNVVISELPIDKLKELLSFLNGEGKIGDYYKLKRFIGQRLKRQQYARIRKK